MDLWARFRRLMRLARRPHGVRMVELLATQPIEVVEVTSDELAADLERAEAGMDLAIDIGDWAEAATLREWARQLRITIELLKDGKE